MEYRILIDTNVLLDYVMKRKQFYDESKIIIESCARNESTGFMAAHSIPYMFYIMRKDYSEQERRNILLKLIKLIDAVGIDKRKIIDSLERRSFSDFEDCLQDECAKECYADFIITRNIKDYSQATVKVILPGDYISLLKEQ